MNDEALEWRILPQHVSIQTSHIYGGWLPHGIYDCPIDNMSLDYFGSYYLLIIQILSSILKDYFLISSLPLHNHYLPYIQQHQE